MSLSKPKEPRHAIKSLFSEAQNMDIYLPAAISLRKSSGFLSFMVRASPGLRISPLYPLSLLSNMVIWPGSYQDGQIKKTPFQVSLFIWQLPILPGRFQPSTFGVCELNFRVRHGNGCILTAIATISEGCSFKTI